LKICIGETKAEKNLNWVAVTSRKKHLTHIRQRYEKRKQLQATVETSVRIMQSAVGQHFQVGQENSVGLAEKK